MLGDVFEMTQQKRWEWSRYVCGSAWKQKGRAVLGFSLPDDFIKHGNWGINLQQALKINRTDRKETHE